MKPRISFSVRNAIVAIFSLCFLLGFVGGAHAQNSNLKVANYVRTLAGGGTLTGPAAENVPATLRQLNNPQGIASCGVSGTSGGILYIGDGSVILQVDPRTGLISTVAGSSAGFNDGAAGAAQFNGITALACDGTYNLYIADTGNNRIRLLNLPRMMVSTVAGGGASTGNNIPATSAALNGPTAVAVNATGTAVAFADGVGTGAVIRQAVIGGNIATIAGGGSSAADGSATSVQLNQPQALVFDPSGTLYIADTGNNRIRTLINGAITTIAGTGIQCSSSTAPCGDNGPATLAQLSQPMGMVLSVDNGGGKNQLIFNDYGNNRIRLIDFSSGGIMTALGTGIAGDSGDGGLMQNATLQGLNGGFTSLLNGGAAIDTVDKVVRGVMILAL